MTASLHVSVRDHAYHKMLKHRPKGMSKSEWVETLMLEALELRENGQSRLYAPDLEVKGRNDLFIAALEQTPLLEATI